MVLHWRRPKVHDADRGLIRGIWEKRLGTAGTVELARRLMARRWTLDPEMEVRLLPGQCLMLVDFLHLPTFAVCFWVTEWVSRLSTLLFQFGNLNLTVFHIR